MDNITHSLIGTIVGRSIPLKDERARAACIWTSILGNNLPDIDIILQPILGQGRLGGLLHHRGFTHTVLAAPILGLVAMFIGFSLGRLSLKTVPLKTRFYLFSVGVFSVLLHILADYCNNYGVHPFAPFGNRWYYGDFMFILEPLLWLCVLPLIYFESAHLMIRRCAFFLGATVLGTAWLVSQVPSSIAAAITVWGLLFAAAQKRIRGVRVSIVGVLIIVTSFYTSSFLAKSSIKNILKNANPQETLVDLSLSPSPGNPFCWQVDALSITRRYIVRSGGFSLWPLAFAPQGCFLREPGIRTAPVTPATINSPVGTGPFPLGQLQWSEEFEGSFEELQQLKVQNCRFAAFLKFARFPFWTRTSDGFIAGDLRYDREKGLGFSEIRIDDDEFKNQCPRFVPAWETPLLLYLKGLFS